MLLEKLKYLLEQTNDLSEKLIVFNNGKKNGQVVVLAGGAGSGKGYAKDTLMDTSNYKSFDVDDLKKRIIKLAKIKGNNPELANLDLKKPSDVAKLHQYVSDKGLADKQLSTFLSQIDKSRGLPNLLFDTTLKDPGKFDALTEPLIELGYKKEDMHLVWVAAKYDVAVSNNKDRDRVVPSDILFLTHQGAAATMSDIIMNGRLPSNLDGEVYVLFSDREESSVPYKDSKGKVKTGISDITGKETRAIKDFIYVKVKDSGKSIRKDKEIKKQVIDIAQKVVPSSSKGLFSID